MRHKLLRGVNDLATVNPLLVSEWDYERNGGLTPKDVTISSGKKVWWRCKLGHEWQSIIETRSKGVGCPYCANKKVLVGFNDLTTTNPELASEWNYDKNGDLTPKDVTKGTDKKVWWICSIGHEWEARILSRSSGNGCPYCSGRYAWKGYNDLATINPKLASEWNYEKNRGLRPEDVTVGCNKKVWWRCSRGHEWEAIIVSRSKGIGCPYCSGRYAWRGFNDLTTINPKLASEWNYEKNGNLRPEDVTSGSTKKVWWKCSKGHEWEAVIGTRSKGIGCPYCTAKSTSYGEQFLYWSLKELHPDTKSRVKLNQIFKNKSLKHPTSEYDIYIPSLRLAIEYSGTNWHDGKEEIDVYKQELASKSGLRFFEVLEDKKGLICEGKRIEKSKEGYLKIIKYIEVKYANRTAPIYLDLEKIHDLAIEYSKGKVEYKESLAFLNHELASEWNYERNKNLTPKDVTISSQKKVWWKCNKGHEWEAIIGSRSKGIGCPYCVNKKVLKGFNDLITTNPKLASEWNYERNGNLTPKDVTSGTDRKVWWKCVRGHEWEAVIYNRSKGQGCPYCSNKKVLVGYNDLATVNSLLALEWDYEKNGDLTPEDVTVSSNKKVWWKCKRGHEWEATINKRSSGCGCPYCSGHRVLKGFNDLSTINPKLASEWNYEKNVALRPEGVTCGSHKKVWWRCSKDHEWEAIIKSRSSGCGCPYCYKESRKSK